MSKFTVDGALLLQAVKAVLPHVPLDKDSDEGSCMHFNVTETAELLVTGDGWGSGACAVVPLEDWDGELTDFQVHKDDVNQIKGVFGGRINQVEVSVTHRTMKHPQEFDKQTGEPLPVKTDRVTQLHLEEAGQLFGGRVLQLGGLDARSFTPESLWQRLSRALTAPSAPMDMEASADRLGKFKAAEAAYKTDAEFRTAGNGGGIYIKAGPRFIGYCSAYPVVGEDKTSLEDWGARLDTAHRSTPAEQPDLDAVQENLAAAQYLKDQGMTVTFHPGSPPVLSTVPTTEDEEA